MKLTTRREIWQEFFDALEVASNEVRLTWTGEKLMAKATDIAHVCNISVLLPTEAMIAVEGDEVKFGVDVAKMREILRIAGPNEPVTLDYTKGESKVVIGFGILSFTLELPVLEGVSESISPLIEPPLWVRVQVGHLWKAVRAASQVTDKVAFLLRAEGLTIQANGEHDLVTVRIPRESIEDMSLFPPKEEEEGKEICVRSLFLLDYLVSFIRVIPEDPPSSLTLHLGQDYPLKIIFGKAIHGIYLLAPAVEG